jgi:ABC-type antimicrobial peptide transport system permease subunit
MGVIAGLCGAVALQRVMASQLLGVSPLDPVVIAAVASVVSFTAIAAALLPALSATQVDPSVALRQE